jgi:hypothetical protein
MPGIEYCLVTREAAVVLANRAPVLAQLDPVGMARISTGLSTTFAMTEYLLLSNRTRQVVDAAAVTAWNPSKRLGYRARL